MLAFKICLCNFCSFSAAFYCNDFSIRITRSLVNIELITGDFNNTIDATLKKFEKLDYVFIDGNHQKAPTLNYFKKCLSKSNHKSIFILDDVNWSKEMKAAWKEIKAHPEVTLSIDLFFLGIVFFNPDFTKQNFVVRF